MHLNNEIIELMRHDNCNIVSFADLRDISKEARQNFKCGILLGLSYSKEAMQENKNGLPKKYYDEFTHIQKKLPVIAEKTAKYLTDKGYKALAKVPSMVIQDEARRTILPHKTVATLSGIGWIGKCAALVTNEVGSALRIIVVLTDAPLECGEPITKSLCNPNCSVCADVCPGKAPSGQLWDIDVDRDEFFNAHACFSAARSRAKELLNINETICALCISNCPFTRKGLGY